MSDDATYDFDVFISYSSKDKEWVRGELLKRIEAAGLKAFIDFRDFTRGAQSIKEMERGVEKCRKTLLILTSNYVQSGWTEVESVMAQTLDPANESLRLIPLLKTECKKPLRIGTLTHIDFTENADHDLAWRQLLTALGAPPELPQSAEPERPSWNLVHPYPMPPNFTGRVSERGTLTRWLNEDNAHPLLVLRALGGFGKSALTWHWLTHDVDATIWPKVLWWSFYEGDASFDQFVAEAFGYINNSEAEGERLSVRQAMEGIVNRLNHTGILLVLDGFERVMRAFGGMEAAYQGDVSSTQERERDCVSPLAERFLCSLASLPQIKGKVILTTRLMPRILEAKDGTLLNGCLQIGLRQMQPNDAVSFFHAQGIRGTHTEIKLACEYYGYHPLSLRLLTGLILGDFQLPGDISAAKRLDVSGNLVQRQHHVLELAYEALRPAQQKLLGQIACFRWPVIYDTLKAAAESTTTLESDLHGLITRGLLHHDIKARRFDLHPIVRHYAYDRLAAPVRTATHTRLLGYFTAVPAEKTVTCLEHLGPVIELYHHTVRAGKFDEALTLFRDRLADPLYYQLGAYALLIDLLRPLFPDDQSSASQPTIPRLDDESDQAWTLNTLANAYSLSGQPSQAVSMYALQNIIREDLGDRKNLVIGLLNLASMAEFPVGSFQKSEANLRRSINLSHLINDELSGTIGHLQRGRLLAYCGAFSDAETELEASLAKLENLNSTTWQGITLAYKALSNLLRTRYFDPNVATKHTVALSRRALELADEHAKTNSPVLRDYVRAHWLLGAAYRVSGDYTEAENHLNEALERCRRINLVEFEADILNDLARLRLETKKIDEAQRFAEEALLITERSGYVLQGADAHLELAKLALIRGDKAAAKDHAQAAKKLAYCDGLPDYTYKAAYEEARALVKQLQG